MKPCPFCCADRPEDEINDDGIAMPVVVLDHGIKDGVDITTNDSFQEECCTTGKVRERMHGRRVY